MAYGTSSLSGGNSTQPVAITSVDTVKRTATAMTRRGSTIMVDLNYAAGAVHVTPAVGEQWFVTLENSMNYRLVSKLPANSANLNTQVSEGQVRVGSSGPLELDGAQVNVNSGVLQLGQSQLRSSGGALQQNTGTTDDPNWTSVTPGDTDAVPEGANNLYFTDARAAAAAPVQSVGGQTGDVVIDSSVIGLGNVDNTSDADKPLSNADIAALATKADEQELVDLKNRLLTDPDDVSGSTIQVPALPTNIPQDFISGLTTALSDLVSTGDWTPLLNLLFGDGTTSVPSGGTIQVPALPQNIPQNYITDLVDDLGDAIKTGDWNPVMEDLFGTGGWSSGATIQVPALPQNIPQNYIQDLTTDLGNAITTGDWNPVMEDLFGSGGWSSGATIQVPALPQNIPQNYIQDLTTDLGDAIKTGDWNPVMQDLFGSGGWSSGANLQNSVLPSSFANINQDFLNLFNDVIFANGRGWDDIGADLKKLIDDILGGNSTQHSITPGQIPPTNVASTGSGPNLGADVSNAMGAATSAGNDAAAIASQVSSVVSPSIPAAPTWLWASEVTIPSGHPGVGAAGDDIWYRVTAVNAAGESIASNAVYAHAWLGPIAVKLTWQASAGATKYWVYRGVASDPFVIFPSEPALTEYTDVGNVTTWTDTGD